MINPFIYIITFSILFQSLSEVRPQTTTLKPDLREAHTATFINDKLYISGGSIPNSVKTPIETFLFFNFSNNFNTNNSEWINLSNIDIVPSHRYATCSAINNTLFLYGGESLSDRTMDLVYTFNTNNNVWNIPNITGIPPTVKESITSIVDNNGLMYLFGGRLGTAYSNDFFALDTINFIWKKLSSINAPSPRAEYGAVLLPDKNIIYMGGNNNNGVFDLNQVYLYNTINDNWSTKTTSGSIPTARSSFSSVLGLDGQKVIIFGGFENGATNITPGKSLYVLDLNNFNWSIPTTIGKIPSNRVFHKSVLIEKYMVITFGEGYSQGVENDVLMLDISNSDGYIWTTSFEIPPTTTTAVETTGIPADSPTPSKDPNSHPPVSSNSPIIISLAVLLSVGVLLIASVFYIRMIKSSSTRFRIPRIPRIPISRNGRPTPQYNDEINFNVDNRALELGNG